MKNPFDTQSSSQAIFTTMIGHVTKPIMVVKIPCELLCVIKVKGFFINNQLNFLASELLVADSFTTETSWP